MLRLLGEQPSIRPAEEKEKRRGKSMGQCYNQFTAVNYDHNKELSCDHYLLGSLVFKYRCKLQL